MASRDAKEALIVVALLAAALAGCGGGPAKRAVDPQAEAFAFFPADAPVVAILKPEPATEVAALDEAAQGLPAWSGLRELALGPLHSAGLGRQQLAALARPEEEIEGVDASILAVGAATQSDVEARLPLLVFVTDQQERLSGLLRRAAASGRLRADGEVDDASLYRNRVASFAERDGVLVAAESLADVRAAIERRDGDSDEQLDADVVGSDLDELEDSGPLLVYGNASQLRDGPELAQLLSRRPLIDSAQTVVASARAVDGSVEMEVVLTLDRDAEELGDAYQASSIGIAARVPGVGSVSAAGPVSEDEIRLRFTL